MSDALTPLERWLRVVDAVQIAADREDAEWFMSAYQRAIDSGCSLDVAFGLARHGGAGGLSRRVRLQERDEVLRRLYVLAYGDLDPRQAAGAIIVLLATRRRACRLETPTEAEALADAILLTGLAAPKLNRLADILRGV